MKKFRTAAIIAAIFLMPAVLYFFSAAKEVQANSQPDTTALRRITVNGSGAVKAKPDVAYVNVGVQTESADAKEAQAQNTASMNKVIDSVKALGINEKDIKTAGYYMYPKYNYNEKTETITGYVVNNTVTVTVRDIEKAGDVIDATIGAGANVTNSVQFNASDPSPYYQSALTAAMADAKAKGTAISEALGVKIDLPIEVVEQSSYLSPLSYGNANSQVMYESTGKTAIQSGELEISASVSVTYGY